MSPMPGPQAMLRRLAVTAAATACLAASPTFADIAPGERTITLVAADGQRLKLGRASLAPREGGGLGVKITLDAPEFQDEFLSMRPFRCLTAHKEMWCHLPYPYETRGTISNSDLVDLEYALLFLFKPPTAYGIDAWNGLYFKLAVEPDGAIAGAAHEVDLDVLATPPADRKARTIAPADLTPVAPTAHAFTRVEIR